MAAHPPIISLHEFEERKGEITQQLSDAAMTSGFFYVTGHNISQSLIDRNFEVNKRYFNMPAEEKAALPQVDWGKQHYFGHNVGNSSQGNKLREGHWKWWDTHAIGETAYPREELVPGFKEATKEIMAAFPDVFNKILECYALGLGYPEDFFRKVADVKNPDNHSVFICNKYEAVEGKDFKPGTSRITAHTDETLITLLMTSPGSAGLELAAGKDGKAVDSQNGLFEVEAWHPCPHIPGCITVNIGDALQRFSDGLLKSNFHRVRMPADGESQDERYSLVAFVWANDSAICQGPKKVYPAVTFAKFMDVKSAGFDFILSKSEEIFEHAQGLNIALGNPTVTATA